MNSICHYLESRSNGSRSVRAVSSTASITWRQEVKQFTDHCQYLSEVNVTLSKSYKYLVFGRLGAGYRYSFHLLLPHNPSPDITFSHHPSTTKSHQQSLPFNPLTLQSHPLTLSQLSRPATNLPGLCTMASFQAHGHNPTCPEAVADDLASFAAEQVHQAIGLRSKADRCRTPYVGLEVADLPQSAALINEDGADSSTFFNNQLEAKKYRQLLLPQKPEIDATIPQDQDDLKAHVKVLFQAFKCVPSGCI